MFKSNSDGRGLISGAAEAEDRVEDDAEEGQTDAEAGAFAEGLGDVDREDDRDDEVHKRDEKQEDPPTRTAADFKQDVEIVDGNDRRPTGLTGFDENLPDSNDSKDNECEVEENADCFHGDVCGLWVEGADGLQLGSAISA